MKEVTFENASDRDCNAVRNTLPTYPVPGDLIHADGVKAHEDRSDEQWFFDTKLWRVTKRVFHPEFDNQYERQVGWGVEVWVEPVRPDRALTEMGVK